MRKACFSRGTPIGKHDRRLRGEKNTRDEDETIVEESAVISAGHVPPPIFRGGYADSFLEFAIKYRERVEPGFHADFDNLQIGA